MGLGLSLATLYDSDVTDEIDSHVSDSDWAYHYVIEETLGVVSYEVIPAHVVAMGITGPAADALTRDYATAMADRCSYGYGDDSVTPFEFTAATSQVDLPTPFDRDSDLFLILEEKGTTLTRVTVTSGANTKNQQTAGPGIWKIDLSSFGASVTNATLDVTSPRTGKGYFLIGNAQEIVSG